MRLEGFEEPTATVRDAIEAQNETKYIKMMGQAPETPIASKLLSHHHVADADP